MDPSNLAPGTRVASYRIEAFLGSGGMGVVYRARDERLNRSVALKVLPEIFARNSRRSARFEREARAVAALSHPNILSIHDFGIFDGVAFAAMELLEGETLGNALRGGRLPPRKAIDYAVQITQGLAAAHDRGIVHRDLKPDNVFVTHDGRIKIVDFGLAKHLDADRSPNDPTVSESKIVGTAGYMAPEQVRGGKVDARSDIFAFGAVLYEMLSGRRAFKGDSSIDTMNAIINHDPPDLTDSERGVTPAIARVVRRCLEKRPAERFQSARDLGFALDEAWSGSTPGGLPHQAAGVRRRLNRRAYVWSAAAVTLTAALVWIVWPRLNRQSDPGPSSPPRITAIVSERIGSGGGISRVAWAPPDGRLIAYSLHADGRSTIWVKQVLGGAPRAITDGTWNDRDPIWSPDGQRLAFISDRGGTPGVWVMPYLGGTPELVKQMTYTGWSLIGWSGGTIYFEASRSLYALDVAAGQTTEVAAGDSDRSRRRDFRASPDGNLLAYADVRGETSRIAVVPLQGGKPVEITSGEAHDIYPTWFPDGKTIAFSSSRAGGFQVYLARVDRRDVRQVTFDGDIAHEFLAASPQGERILSVSQKNHANIFSNDSQAGAEAAQTADLGLLQLSPDVSRDGSRIAFQSASSNTTAGESILIAAVGSPGSAFTIAADGFDPKWSPADDTVGFLRPAAGTFEIWRVSASGKNERRLTSGVLIGGTTGVPYNRLAVNYNWSPDGKRIAFVSSKGGAQNVWTVSSDDGSETRISSNTDPALRITSPCWSADGTRIAYLVEQAAGPPAERIRSVVASPASGLESATPVWQGTAAVRLLGWSASGAELFIVVGEGGNTAVPHPVQLLRISTSRRAPQTIARIPAVYLHNIKLSAGRQSVAFVSRQDGRDNIQVVSTAGGSPRKVTANTDPTVYYSGVTWSPDGKALFYSKQTSWSVISLIEGFTR